MTNGAAAVIPEVLAGQILSLARRGGEGHTVLAASGAGDGARDRLVVFLQPTPGDGNDGELDTGRFGTRGTGPRERSKAAAADERARHALVVSCVPGQVVAALFSFTDDIDSCPAFMLLARLLIFRALPFDLIVDVQLLHCLHS